MREDETFLNEIVRQKDHIQEIYFSWGSYANGRASQLQQSGLTPWQAQARQEQDLCKLARAGIPMNILFNAMCYGRDSQSRAFFTGIGNTVDYLSQRMSLVSVTTTSLLIAKFIKENFPELDVRASVNMGIGTIEGMEYVRKYFDSFYVQRELNRDFDAVRKLKSWCDNNGKTLYMLANSGCLNHCSAHVFHDNLVAHEAEIAQMDNGYVFKSVCSTYLQDPANYPTLLERTSFIRPEDVRLYEDLIPAMKLATRVHCDPVGVLKAYVAGRYPGNALALLEPNHAAQLYPYWIANDRLESRLEHGKLTYANTENAWIRLE